MTKVRVRKVRAGQGVRSVGNGQIVEVLSNRTRYVIDRFNVYLERRAKREQMAAIKEALPKLVELRKHLAETLGEESQDHLYIERKIEDFAEMYRRFKTDEAIYKGETPVFDADLERKVYG